MRESGADIDNATIVGVGLIGTFLIAVAILLVQALFASFDRADTERKARTSPALTDYRADQNDRLKRYRWVNEGDGVVAVPVDRAIDLLSERGLPAPPTPTATPPAKPGEVPEG